MTDPRTIPDDLARWHWLTSKLWVFRLTNGCYTTKAHAQPGQAFDEARTWLCRSALAVQTSFLDNDAEVFDDRTLPRIRR